MTWMGTTTTKNAAPAPATTTCSAATTRRAWWMPGPRPTGLRRSRGAAAAVTAMRPRYPPRLRRLSAKTRTRARLSFGKPFCPSPFPATRRVRRPKTSPTKTSRARFARRWTRGCGGQSPPRRKRDGSRWRAAVVSVSVRAVSVSASRGVSPSRPPTTHPGFPTPRPRSSQHPGSLFPGARTTGWTRAAWVSFTASPRSG
mmetsp:Transcript_6150/g.20536  ORF Transcript_6150/g.20536 Transcript_6150/m.20536 type:complete len:200 (+) Transcript_6150:696-1295(+)